VTENERSFVGGQTSANSRWFQRWISPSARLTGRTPHTRNQTAINPAALRRGRLRPLRDFPASANAPKAGRPAEALRASLSPWPWPNWIWLTCCLRTWRTTQTILGRVCFSFL